MSALSRCAELELETPMRHRQTTVSPGTRTGTCPFELALEPQMVHICTTLFKIAVTHIVGRVKATTAAHKQRKTRNMIRNYGHKCSYVLSDIVRPEDV